MENRYKYYLCLLLGYGQNKATIILENKSRTNKKDFLDLKEDGSGLK